MVRQKFGFQKRSNVYNKYGEKTSEIALIRETKEELGLDISPFLNSLEYLYTFKDTLIENNGTYFDYDITVKILY